MNHKILKVDLIDRTVTELHGWRVIKRDASMQEIRQELDKRQALTRVNLEYPKDEIATIKRRDYSAPVEPKIALYSVLKSMVVYTAIIGAMWVFVTVFMIIL